MLDTEQVRTYAKRIAEQNQVVKITEIRDKRSANFIKYTECERLRNELEKSMYWRDAQKQVETLEDMLETARKNAWDKQRSEQNPTFAGYLKTVELYTLWAINDWINQLPSVD